MTRYFGFWIFAGFFVGLVLIKAAAVVSDLVSWLTRRPTRT